jgi:hypothetical protein
MSRHVGSDRHHFVYRLPQEKMVMGNLVRPTHPPSQLQQPPHGALRSFRRCREIAHPGRTKPFRATQ